jgi:hypothetical protein
MQEDEDLDRFTEVLAATVKSIVNEPVLLARLEPHFSPKPASLVPQDSDEKEFQQRVDRLIVRLGGPPNLIFRGKDEPRPRYDEYPGAAMHEVVNMFHRTRRSVTRAQMSLIGSHLLHEKPEVLSLPTEGDVQAQFLKTVESRFWELTETAYIRLASYWDRVGQLLDFVFFGIRQFDRDGFTAVVDRIRNNFVPVDTVLTSLPAWNSLRTFQSNRSPSLG